MSDSMELPPPARVFGLITGMWAAQAAATCASLGIPDVLAHGPKTAEEVAKALSLHSGATYRLLRGVASVGVLRKTEDGRFALTPVGELLRKGVPGSMRSLLIAEMAPGHWLPWADLAHSVRTGEPAVPKTLGMDAWSYYRAHPEEERFFSEGMTGISAMATGAVLASYSFADAKKVVDVGGAHGGFLAAVLNREPTAKGVLFDQPQVVESAGATLEAAGVASRVERVGGSFFESVPAGGDVYLLKHILHDWNDAECVAILERVRAAMAPGAKVVVVEMLITDDGPPSPAPLMDLNMLVMLTGRERTAEEFGALFAKAGLRLAGVTPTHSPMAVIEAVAG
ncbi:MAG: methyltransferase [Polyangiales bacterium]